MSNRFNTLAKKAEDRSREEGACKAELAAMKERAIKEWEVKDALLQEALSRTEETLGAAGVNGLHWDLSPDFVRYLDSTLADFAYAVPKTMECLLGKGDDGYVYGTRIGIQEKGEGDYGLELEIFRKGASEGAFLVGGIWKAGEVEIRGEEALLNLDEQALDLAGVREALEGLSKENLQEFEQKEALLGKVVENLIKVLTKEGIYIDGVSILEEDVETIFFTSFARLVEGNKDRPVVAALSKEDLYQGLLSLKENEGISFGTYVLRERGGRYSVYQNGKWQKMAEQAGEFVVESDT